MRTRIVHLWEDLSSSYWFVPATMVFFAGLLALGTLWIDRHWNAPVTSDWIYTGGAEGSRALLSTVAGSVITVAGVVFSITIATLTQASSQFGPRLLRNFMRDTGNQVVLGTFVATFFYCLLVLRAVRGLQDASFVPNLSVTTAVLMAAWSLAVLIYFIHHISRTLQGPQVVAAVGIELQRAIRKSPPTRVRKDCGCITFQPPPPRASDLKSDVFGTETGYLQAIDEEGLLNIAIKADAIIYLQCRPGDYLIKGNVILAVECAKECGQAIVDSLVRCFFLGRQRTAEQELEYSVRQLVEIAVRALSPGINDPFTAMNSLDWLGAAIGAVAEQGLPTPDRSDSDGKVRIVSRVSTFPGFVDAAFNQIRQFGRDSVAVNLRVLEVIASAAQRVQVDAQRKVLLHHVEMIYSQSADQRFDPSDVADIRERYLSARSALFAERIQHV